MLPRRDSANVGVKNGVWGEDVAVEYLRRTGFQIVDRNSCPVERDRRLEIDLVAWDPKSDAMVFVEVKQHKARSLRQRRLRSVDRHKQELLRTACRTWLRRNGWKGAYRFDVVEVYGTPQARQKVEIDHIERVRLFENERKFINWAD